MAKVAQFGEVESDTDVTRWEQDASAGGADFREDGADRGPVDGLLSTTSGSSPGRPGSMGTDVVERTHAEALLVAPADSVGYTHEWYWGRSSWGPVRWRSQAGDREGQGSP